MASPCVSLADFLAGVVLRRAFLAFEAALFPWVKGILQREFPEEPTGNAPQAATMTPRDTLDSRRQAAANCEQAVKLAEANKQALLIGGNKEALGKATKDVNVAKQELKKVEVLLQLAEHGHVSTAQLAAIHDVNQVAADAGLDKCLNVVRQCIDKAKREHAAALAAAPVPRWIQEARRVVGDKTAPHVKDDHNAWDTFMLVSVIRGLLPDVFEHALLRRSAGERSAKVLLDSAARACSARTRRAHNGVLSEYDSLETLAVLRDVLHQCHGVDAEHAAKIDGMLKHAQSLMARARTAPPTAALSDETLDEGELRALLLYIGERDFERRLVLAAGEIVVGATIQFVGADAAWAAKDPRRKRLKALSNELVRIASLRTWLFHHTAEVYDDARAVAVFADMDKVLHELDGIIEEPPREAPPAGSTPDQNSKWARHMHELQADPSLAKAVSVRLSIEGGRMSIPVAEERCLVGRKDAIGSVVDAVLAVKDGGGTRVLVRGMAGVGKDVVAIEAVRDKRVAAAFELQAWLLGSTNEVFKAQLLRLFETHRPDVVRPFEGQPDVALRAVQRWLAANDGWLLVVEDVARDCTAVAELLPPGLGATGANASAKGCVIYTSQERLQTASSGEGDAYGITLAVELGELSSADCVRVWRKMGLFAKQVAARDDKRTDAELEAAVAASADVACPHASSAAGSAPCAHCQDVWWAVEAAPMPARGASGGAKALNQWRKETRAKLFEHEQLLSTAALRDFFQETLFGLPLSVQLAGHMVRSQAMSAAQLVDLYDTMPLAEVDKDGRNAVADRHYYGLVRSVMFAVARILETPRLSEGVRHAAVGLLGALAVLHPTLTPQALFAPSRDVLSRAMSRVQGEWQSGEEKEDDASGPPMWALFGATADALSSAEEKPAIVNPAGAVSNVGVDADADGALMVQAAELLRDLGLLRDEANSSLPTATVGAVHQLVQRCVRERLLDMLPAASPSSSSSSSSSSSGSAIDSVALLARRGAAGVRYVLPQALRYDSNSRDVIAARSAVRPLAPSAELWCRWHEAAGRCELDAAEVCLEMGTLSLDDGRVFDAVDQLQRANSVYVRLLRDEHPDTLRSMNNFANAYKAAGRTQEAIELLERVRDVQERVMGAEHPETLSSMNNLATAYDAAGRTQEAITLLERVRDVQERVLGAEHPGTLTSMSNLANAYNARGRGRTQEAIALLERVRDVQERVLGAEHPGTLSSMNNLASAYKAAGRTQEAIALHERVRVGHERVLGAEHPEAIALHERVRDVQERVMGAEHPDTLTSMNNLASAHRAAGRTQEAITLLERVRVGHERVLGAEHPDTLTSMNNLASVYNAAGRTQEAIALHERVQDVSERVLGAEHPGTLSSMNNLASVYRAVGRTADAIELCELLMERTTAEHPLARSTADMLIELKASLTPQQARLLKRRRDQKKQTQQLAAQDRGAQLAASTADADAAADAMMQLLLDEEEGASSRSSGRGGKKQESKQNNQTPKRKKNNTKNRSD